MKYSGVFHLGVHKATLAEANARSGDRVAVTIELDDQPLPTDVLPDDLAKAIAGTAATRAAWTKLSPAHRREHVKQVIEAKKPETRARRMPPRSRRCGADEPGAPVPDGGAGGSGRRGVARATFRRFGDPAADPRLRADRPRDAVAAGAPLRTPEPDQVQRRRRGRDRLVQRRRHHDTHVRERGRPSASAYP